MAVVSNGLISSNNAHDMIRNGSFCKYFKSLLHCYCAKLIAGGLLCMHTWTKLPKSTDIRNCLFMYDERVSTIFRFTSSRLLSSHLPTHTHKPATHTHKLTHMHTIDSRESNQNRFPRLIPIVANDDALKLYYNIVLHACNAFVFPPRINLSIFTSSSFSA